MNNITIFLFIIGVILLIVKVFNKKSEEGTRDLIFTTGISLIISSSPDLLANIVSIFALITKQTEVASKIQDFNMYTFWAGCSLLIISVGMHIIKKNKICVLNINGYGKYNLEEYFDKKFSLNDYKERELNFQNIYNRIFKKRKDDESVQCILEQIKEDVTGFKNESKGLKKGYTGIAPIPFIMYAGTFLNREKIDKYYEYDKKKCLYSELSNKKESYPRLLIDTNINNLNENKKEITLVISITQKIQDDDIKQFIRRSNVVKLHTEKIQDNIIISVKQLDEYTNLVFDTIQKIKDKLGNISKINMIISSQSCFALEIGKRSADNTRLPQIVSYQFEQQNKIKYPWGIIINSDNANKLVKEE